jgi:hypothetical protein
VANEYCVIWQIVPDVLKALHSFKMVITIYKLPRHNIPEDLNVNIQQHYWQKKNLLNLTHSHVTGDEVKNGQNCTYGLCICLNGIHRDNLVSLPLLFPYLGGVFK